MTLKEKLMYRTVENLREALAKQLLINEQLLSDRCELNSRVNKITLENNKLKTELSNAEWKIKKLEEPKLNIFPTIKKELSKTEWEKLVRNAQLQSIGSVLDERMSNFLERYGQNEQGSKQTIFG